MPETPVYVMGNVEALRRIFSNLISNAIHYGADGAYLGLFLTTEEDKAIVRVVDHGKGIEKAFADSVFDRLFTMEDSRSRKVQGNGLGLTIAKNLAEKLEGSLTVESTPGVITTFHMLSEIESIADTIGIIHHGEMKKEIGIKEMEENNLTYVEVAVANTKMAAVILSDILGLTNFKILEAETGVPDVVEGKNMTSAFPIDYSMANVGFYIQLLMKAFVIVTMSFIALFIGLAMKSSKATIVSSFLLIFLTQANVGDFTMSDQVLFPIFLMIVSLIFAFLSVWKVESRDLM